MLRYQFIPVAKFFRREFFRIFALILGSGATIIGAWFLLHRPLFVESAPLQPRVESAVDKVITARRDAVLNTSSNVPFGENNEINILILGIDSRKEGSEQHCDAIHMLTVDTQNWTMLMTSVPRGTYAYIPPGNYEETEYYLANACAFAGLDYGIDQIERIVGVKADYTVTVGFSQVYGILGALQLPTVESLQWLRHRRSYQIGDPQRSQNQAVFMKDLALKFLDGDGLSTPMLYLLYTFIDTDMDFATVKALHDGMIASSIATRPDDIVLAMKPEYETVDMHLDFTNPDPQIAALLDRIRAVTSKDDLSDRTISEVQTDLVSYLDGALASGESVANEMDAQLWRQIVDDDERERFHYAFVEAYAYELLATDHDAAVQLVADYILEKQTLGIPAWEEKGRALLDRLLE